MSAPEQITLTSPGGNLSATFLPGLGMVASSLRHGDAELLAQLGGPAAYAERGSTFGVPILHPWANRLFGWDYSAAGAQVHLEPDAPLLHKDEAGRAIHGVLAACPDWSVTERTATTLTAELDYGADARRLAVFPFPHRLSYEAAISEQALAIVVTIRPSGERAVPVSFGFHPYLTLPGSDRRRWRLQLPVRGGALDGELGERTFDDGFETLSGPRFSVADEHRRITVDFQSGYPVAQVFAPANSDFICFEPMTAPTDALRTGRGLRVVEPGAEFRATFAIRVD
ncbi:MAG: aldose 1-epimerase [Solirubrobacterales bacterium]|nr:aldose 1-epimerase [Solirubrobacterales bacterium]